MKSRELIRRIQEIDPTGEEECCIDNADIYYIGKEPAYYDGRLQVFEFDAHGRPVSARRVSSGKKIVLSPIYIHNALDDDPEFKVAYNDEEDRKRNEPHDEERRSLGRRTEYEHEMKSFVNWVFVRIQADRKVHLSMVDKIRKAAEEFYTSAGLTPENPFIVVRQGRSYAECREEYFEEAFSVGIDEYSRVFIKVREKKEGPVA